MQETIGGGDDRLYGALCCFSRLGEPLATMTKRKLRQYPEGFGNGSVQVSLDLPELAARSERILGSLGCRGFMSIEYKHDPADGRMKLIEINPRLVSGLQMAIDSGLDLPWLGYCDIVGAAAGELRAPRHGTIFMNEAWELRRVLSKRTAWAWADAALMAMRARSFAVWSVRDPGPLWSLAKRAWRGELQRF
jgi:predicted ATP-grasp superfamily ATP-dependent carboligase